MRQIGSINNGKFADRFVDFLKTQGINAQAEGDEEAWAIWVRDENQLEAAREELEKFRAEPDAAKYTAAVRQAAELRDAEIKQRRAARKRVQVARDSWGNTYFAGCPAVKWLIIACVAVAIFRALPFGQWLSRYLMFTDVLTQVSTFGLIMRGQVWRLVTPIFLHGGPIHLLFNMYWIYFFGTQIERKLGTRSFLVLVLATAIGGNVLQAVLVGPQFLGISGVVYGLFGYMWVRIRDGYMLSDLTIIILCVMFVFGFARPASYVAVWAHAGGLLAGLVLAYYPQLLRRVR